MVLKPMATDAKEPTFSMGDDTPFAAVAGRAAPGLPLPEAAVRPGQQPADRPPPRAPRDVAAHLPRPAPAAAHRGPRRRAPARAPDLLPVPRRRRRRSSTRRTTRSRRCCSTRRSRSPRVPAGLQRAARGRWRATASTPCRPAPGSSWSPTTNVGPDRAADPVAARDRRDAPPPGRGRIAPGRLARRSTPATRATRTRSPACSVTAPTRSARGIALHTVAAHGRRRPARRAPLVRGAGEAPGRGRGRRAQDLLEDGDLHRRRVPRRADLRGARPRRRGRRPVPARARRRPSAASASTRSAPTCSSATRPGSRTTKSSLDEPGLHPVPQARWRVPRQQPGRHLDALHASIGLKVDNPDADDDGDDGAATPQATATVRARRRPASGAARAAAADKFAAVPSRRPRTRAR